MSWHDFRNGHHARRRGMMKHTPGLTVRKDPDAPRVDYESFSFSFSYSFSFSLFVSVTFRERVRERERFTAPAIRRARAAKNTRDSPAFALEKCPGIVTNMTQHPHAPMPDTP
jgi:hypothetical protein